MHENSRQVQLNLETNVDIGTIDRWRPPERKSTVWNLRQTGTLGVGELLAVVNETKGRQVRFVSFNTKLTTSYNQQGHLQFHALLETRRLLPKETLPRREIRALEQGMLENSFDTYKK